MSCTCPLPPPMHTLGHTLNVLVGGVMNAVDFIVHAAAGANLTLGLNALEICFPRSAFFGVCFPRKYGRGSRRLIRWKIAIEATVQASEGVIDLSSCPEKSIG